MSTLIRDTLARTIQSAISHLVKSGDLPDLAYPVVEVQDTKAPEHGDYATNFAMVSSKVAGRNPRELAELLKGALLAVGSEQLKSVDIAGPGFLNLWLKESVVTDFVRTVIGQGATFGNVKTDKPLKINVEFVSVNPNGPITIGSGRGAAYGSALCSILEACGHTVHREFYINDGVNSEQMRLFAESVRSFLMGTPFPEKGYKGDYVAEVAETIRAMGGFESYTVDDFQRVSQELMIRAQETALLAFGVTFDTWFSEQSLHDKRMVESEIVEMVAHCVADENPTRVTLKLGKGGKIEEVNRSVEEGATEDDAEGQLPTLWLRSTKFGDDMDRVLRRRDGRLTYIASDVAYHKDKFNRPAGADKLITVLGPDHHGYIGRLQAVVAAMLLASDQVTEIDSLGELTEIDTALYGDAQTRDRCVSALNLAREKLEVQIFQLVRFVKDGKPAPMRKRDGNIYAVIDLITEIGQNVRPEGAKEEQLAVGKDVARFFYLMRSHDTTFDFDLDLAARQSDENPVFYVQYAHARICSLIDKATEQGMMVGTPDLNLLVDPRELSLIKKILDLPYDVSRCAADYGVHRIATYSMELARAYHHFYDVCRVLAPENPELSRARLELCLATRIALHNSLALLGISSPERM